MTEARKEQIKLTANWLNIMAAGTVVTGTVTPLIAYAFGGGTTVAREPYIIALASAISLGLGIALHWFARRSLRKLDQ
jgi:hypothetical protein